MTNNNSNQRIFPLVLRKTRTIILKMANFPVSAFLTFLLKINAPNMTFIVTQIMRGIINVIIPKIVITSVIHMINRAISPIIINSPVATFIVKIKNRETVNLLVYNHMVNTATLFVRAISNISAGFNHIVLAGTAQVLIHLNILDPQTLVTLDVQLLSALDHS